MEKEHTVHLELETDFTITGISEKELKRFAENFVNEMVEDVEDATEIEFTSKWYIVEDEK